MSGRRTAAKADGSDKDLLYNWIRFLLLLCASVRLSEFIEREATDDVNAFHSLFLSRSRAQLEHE
jgi:hypothetical protein